MPELSPSGRVLIGQSQNGVKEYCTSTGNMEQSLSHQLVIFGQDAQMAAIKTAKKDLRRLMRAALSQVPATSLALQCRQSPCAAH
jgi:hypothetical protein